MDLADRSGLPGLIRAMAQRPDAPDLRALAEAVPGASIPMGRIGAATLDDNLEAAMSDPFTYDKSNIEEFKSIF